MGLFNFFRAGEIVPPQPQRIRQDIPRKRRIEAGEVTRLVASWNAQNMPADEEVKRNLERVRARSRDLAYNNEYAKKYLQMVATHVVGPSGFTLQSLAADGPTPDRLGRDAIELAWWRWALPGTCEATGRLGFAELQRLVIETVARDGEALLLRRRDAKNPYGYELKLLEIDRLPIDKNETLKNGAIVVMGIEIDGDGRAVAYWLNLGKLETVGKTQVALTRVPAADVLHLYRPGRAEQHRGLPWMHPVMAGLKMLSGYEEAAIVAARVGAAKMGFFTSPDGTADALADDKVDGEFYTDAEAGAFSVLPQGYDFKAWDPDYPHQGYEAFVKARLRSIASGLGIAYHTLANDLADVNYSSARAGTLEERDNWIVLQNWMVDSFLRPVFLDWLDAALKKGAITMPNGSALPAAKAAKFADHQWQGRRWQWVDPLKDIEASALAIEKGLASPQAIAAQQGLDLADVIDAIASANKMATDAGLAPYAAPEPAPAPPPEPEEPDEDDTAMRDLARMAMASLARSMEPREIAPPSVTIHNAPPSTTVNIEATRIDNHLPAPEIINQVNVEPTPIELRAGDIYNQIDVEPTPITAEVNIDVPPPEVKVQLPSRKTTGTITRDAAGNIVATEQIETDA
jgi:lambda family phage portal protein